MSSQEVLTGKFRRRWWAESANEGLQTRVASFVAFALVSTQKGHLAAKNARQPTFVGANGWKRSNQ